MDTGRIRWSIYKAFFGYGYCGIWNLLILILMSILINLCSVAVSLYLAFTLSHKFVNTKEGKVHVGTDGKTHVASEHHHHNNWVLTGIIVASLLSSFAGKFLSSRIFIRISS